MTDVAKTELPDIQKTEDKRGIAIDKVGISDLRYPITVLDRENKEQHTTATLSLSVSLPHHVKGTHMSRFIEVLNSHGSIISVDNISELLLEMKERLNSKNSYLEIEFPYFIRKKAPVTQQVGLIDYKVHFDVSLINEGIDFVMTLKVHVTTLCP